MVALMENIPGSNLVRGQVGTFAMELDAKTVEIELVDDLGETFGLLPLKCSSLLTLHHGPVAA